MSKIKKLMVWISNIDIIALKKMLIRFKARNVDLTGEE